MCLGVENVKKTLTGAGFQELRESQQWNIEPLGKVSNIEHWILFESLFFLSTL